MSKKMDNLKEEYSGKVSFDVFFQDNFTVCVVTHKAKKKISVGVSKRNAESDQYDKSRGVDIATARALVNLDKVLHPRKYQRLKDKARKL